MFHPVNRSIPEGSYTFSENNLELNQPHEDPSQLLHFPTLTYYGEGEEMLMAQWLSHLKQDHVVSSNNCLDEDIEGSFEVSERATIVAERVNALAEEQKQKQPLVSKSRDNCKKSNNKRPRKRTGKKDRHSKICTAQGPRDRRMRLSLQIARRFFDLQDMLGFDKASKTIEWLLVKSRSAIKELLTKNNLEKRSKIDPNMKSPVLDISPQEFLMEIYQPPNIFAPEHQKKHERKKSRKAVPIFLAKESRDKARARARERTREKMKTKVPQASPSNLEQETCEKNMESRNQEMTSSPMAVAELAEASPQIDPLRTSGNFAGFVGSQPRFLPSSSTSSVAALGGVSSTDALSGKCEVNRAGTWSDYDAMTIMKPLATDESNN